MVYKLQSSGWNKEISLTFKAAGRVVDTESGAPSDVSVNRQRTSTQVSFSINSGKTRVFLVNCQITLRFKSNFSKRNLQFYILYYTCLAR